MTPTCRSCSRATRSSPTSDKYTVLEDDKGLIPAGNVIFIASKKVADEAGPDFGTTIEKVQQNLTLPVIQELNSRVDIDKQEPAKVAHDYLKSSGLGPVA